MTPQHATKALSIVALLALAACDGHKYAMLRACNNELQIQHYAWSRDDGTFWYGVSDPEHQIDKDHVDEVCRR